VLKIISDCGRIAQVQERLGLVLRAEGREMYGCIVGYQGGELCPRVWWLPLHGFWMATREFDTRYWNAFGVVEPHDGARLSITCELNLGFDPTDRRIGGVAIEDDEGTAYIAHRGRVGGGRKGIGKQAFLSQYTGPLEILNSGEVVAVISRLDSPELPDSLSRYIGSVARFKEAVRAGDTGSSPRKPFSFPCYAPEFVGGRRRYTISEEIDAQCQHGLVVDALYRRIDRAGFGPRNNQSMDLFLLPTDDTAGVLFEVKTRCDATSVYTGVGQLLLNTPPTGSWARILVLPVGVGVDLEERVRSLGITVLTYCVTSRASRVSFSGRRKDVLVHPCVRYLCQR